MISEKPMKLASFEAIAGALDDAGVRYLVAGGLAVNAHGYLRFTKDVDMFVTEPFDFDEEYSRALIKPLHDQIEVRFVSAGTLIRMKSAVGRPQDQLDVENLRIIESDDDR